MFTFLYTSGDRLLTWQLYTSTIKTQTTSCRKREDVLTAPVSQRGEFWVLFWRVHTCKHINVCDFWLLWWRRTLTSEIIPRICCFWGFAAPITIRAVSETSLCSAVWINRCQSSQKHLHVFKLWKSAELCGAFRKKESLERGGNTKRWCQTEKSTKGKPSDRELRHDHRGKFRLK